MKKRREMAELLAYILESVDHIKPRKVELDSPEGDGESFCILLTDWHIGKLYESEEVTHFSQEIASQRVDTLIDHVVKLRRKYMPQKFKECVVLLGGDMVDGSEIYAGQGYDQEYNPFDQLVFAKNLLWKLLLTIKEYFPVTRVYGVPGNHGRQSKTAPKDSNLDLYLYYALDIASENHTDLQITYPRKQFFLNFDVNGKRLHLRHIAPSQTETPAPRAKLGGWADQHEYDIFCHGHFHTASLSYYHDRPIIQSGSLVGMDDLAESMGRPGMGMQMLFCVPETKDIMISGVWPIYLN